MLEASEESAGARGPITLANGGVPYSGTWKQVRVEATCPSCPNVAFFKDRSVYDATTDSYLCPPRWASGGLPWRADKARGIAAT